MDTRTQVTEEDNYKYKTKLIKGKTYYGWEITVRENDKQVMLMEIGEINNALKGKYGEISE